MLPKLTFKFSLPKLPPWALKSFPPCSYLWGHVCDSQEGADCRGPGAEGGAVLPALPRQDGHPHLRGLPPPHRGTRGQRAGEAVARRGEAPLNLKLPSRAGLEED